MIISVPWLTTFSSLTYLPTYTWFVLRRNFVTGDSLPCSQDVLIINQRLIAHASIYTHSLSFSQTNSHIILSQKRERERLRFGFRFRCCCLLLLWLWRESDVEVEKETQRERKRESKCDHRLWQWHAYLLSWHTHLGKEQNNFVRCVFRAFGFILTSFFQCTTWHTKVPIRSETFVPIKLFIFFLLQVPFVEILFCA